MSPRTEGIQRSEWQAGESIVPACPTAQLPTGIRPAHSTSLRSFDIPTANPEPRR